MRGIKLKPRVKIRSIESLVNDPRVDKDYFSKPFAECPTSSFVYFLRKDLTVLDVAEFLEETK